MSLALTPAGVRPRARSGRERAAGGVVVPLDDYRSRAREASLSRHPAGRALPPAPAGEAVPAGGPVPLRLTARGRRLARTLVVLVVAGLVAFGVLADRTALGGEQAGPAPVRQVVVLPGDTLWSIAGEVAPGADRRDTVARIVALNGLDGAAVTAGQRLAVPAPAP